MSLPYVSSKDGYLPDMMTDSNITHLPGNHIKGSHQLIPVGGMKLMLFLYIARVDGVSVT